MTEPKTASRGRRGASKPKDEETVVELAVVDEAQVQEQPRAKTSRDLSTRGVGLVGMIEDAPEGEIPDSAKVVDVSWAYPDLRDSFERGAWKAFIALDGKAGDRAIRLAAQKLELGVKVRVETVEWEGDTGEKVEGAKVFFLAKTKTVRGSVPKEDATSQGE